jgi:hypothetical protein
LYNLYIAIPVADDFVIAEDFWSGVVSRTRLTVKLMPMAMPLACPGYIT